MKYQNKWARFFFAEDDGGGSALDVLDADLPEAEPTPEPEPTDPTPEPEPAPAAASVTDPAALATAFAEGLKQAGFTPPTPAKPEDKPLTPEEAKKLLNVYEIDDKFLEEFDNLETRKAKLEAFRDGVIRQADTVTQLRLQQFQQQIEARYAPIESHVSEQVAQAREDRFNKAYPDLAKPELVPLRDTIINGLAAQGALKGKSEPEIFKLIAQSAEAVIQQANPAFKLSPAGSSPTGAKPTKTNPNAIRAATSGAGGGGTGKSQESKSTGNKVLDILG